MGLDDLEIDEVYYWDGEEHFDGSEPDTPMSGDAVPIPPQRVMNIYEEATPVLYRLGQDPSHPAILGKLNRLNARITAANQARALKQTNGPFLRPPFLVLITTRSRRDMIFLAMIP